MASFIQNMLWNSVSGFVEEGKRTVGGYAGDALIKAGDLVENGGRGIGNGIERKATGLGSAIGGQPQQKPSAKALPSTARRPVAHRSNSVPANSKPTSGVPLGAKKYPGSGAGAGVAKKNGIVAAKTTAGVGKGPGATGAAPRSLPKPYGAVNNLPKPYPQNNNKSTGSYPTAKKTAVKAGQPKPFNANAASKDEGKPKPYPGTNTLPGQASRTPVKKYKPLPRMQAPADRGQAKHISV